MKNEIWKVIDDFPNYEVSNKGRVKNRNTGCILKFLLGKDNYYQVDLYDGINRRGKHKRIHRLVAEAFLGKYPDLVVNHINGKIHDNDVDNLEWVTAKENSTLAAKMGLYKTSPIRIKETGEEFDSVKKCAEAIGSHSSDINHVISGVNKSYKGLTFEYIIGNDLKPTKFLRDYQLDAVRNMNNGCILNGGVGSGKSRTGLYYYFTQNGGRYENEYIPMQNPQDLYIITTARKRETYEWSGELSPLLMSIHPELNYYKNKIVVDSWNNIKKYQDVKNAFFILDEQKLVGSGAWVKAFLKIAKSNNWILLSATAGDCWSDYIPVFIANGFYKNRTQFNDEHVVYKRFSKFPQIDKLINTGRLIRLRNKILVDMDFERKTTSHHIDVWCDYPKMKYTDVRKNRWNPYKDEPIVNASELCYTERKVVNSDPTRLNQIIDIYMKHKRVIIFYNFDYELEILQSLSQLETYRHDGTPIFELAEWNGHKHQEIPRTPEWVYLVQYNAGAEGWNCILTDAIIFYSQNYSYKIEEQARGRIDRLNTPFMDLYYYHLKSKAKIDLAISRALNEKKNFNEGKYVSKF